MPVLAFVGIAELLNSGMTSTLTVGFIGCGKMATALAQGFIRANLVAPAQLIGSDVSEASRANFSRVTGAVTTAHNREVLQAAEVVMLSVKPDQVPGVISEIRDAITPAHLLLSIAAGVTLARLEQALPEGTRIVRVMPNTPALVGASATAYAPGRAARTEDCQLVHRLFVAVGIADQVKEPLLDAVTGLSGSGPAYVFLVLEALSDGGVAAGLPREVATRLAAQTLFGSAQMVLETGQHPAALREMVTSPGGTTIEGLHELEKAGVRAALISAVRSAADKSRRLGQG
jgi:pyrroline-5-carboxylate reductase